MKLNAAFKKWVYTSTALVFLFQQISPAFAMEAPEEERDFGVLRTLPASSLQLSSSLPLPEELTSAQKALPSRLEEVRQSLQQTVLESTEAIPDRFSSLIEEIKKTVAEAPTDFRNKVGSKLPNFVKASYSLYPWTFLRNEDDLGKVPVLTSDHAGFRRIQEVMGVLDDLCGESLLPAAFFSNLQQLQSEYKGYIEALCALPLDKRGALLSAYSGAKLPVIPIQSCH
jgi:hypothetical protein